jgi:hypothetical protein
VLRKAIERGRQGINQTETHAFDITDVERFVLTSWLRAERAGLQELADRVLKTGLDYEHYIALLDPDPDNRSADDVTELSRLAAETEILAGEIDVRTGAVDREGRPFPPFREDMRSDR